MTDNNRNNQLIFKDNQSKPAPAEYATSFAELNFDQNQFKFNSRLPIDTNRCQFKMLDRKMPSTSGIDGFAKELDSEEQKFQSQCEFIEEKTKTVREKILSFHKNSNLDEISKQFRNIIFEETKKECDKQEERLKHLFHDAPSSKQTLEKIKSFTEEIIKEVHKLTQQFDTNFLALSSSKQKIQKIETKIALNEAKFKNTERFCQSLLNIISKTIERLSSSFDLENLKEQCNSLSSSYADGVDDFFEYKNQIESLLKNFHEDYLRQKSLLETEENEYRLWKKTAEHLKEEKLSNNLFIEQIIREIETKLDNFKRQEFEYLDKIKILEDQVQTKKNVVDNKRNHLMKLTKQLQESEKRKENLLSISIKLSENLVNAEKDEKQLIQLLKMIEQEEMKMNEKAAQMKIELAVQSTLKQEHNETNQLLANKISELKDMNDKLNQVINEKRLRNEEKKNEPFAEKPKLKKELADLEEELKETTRLHSEIFKDELPDFTQEFIKFFGNDFEIFDPSFNQVMHSLKVQVIDTDNSNNNMHKQ